MDVEALEFAADYASFTVAVAELEKRLGALITKAWGLAVAAPAG